MILLNNTPLEYYGDGLLFYATTYMSNHSLAIVAETIQGEPYASVSINLEEWGFAPEEGQIVLNHDLTTEFVQFFCKHFCKEEKTPIRYGFANSYIVNLKPEYIKKITEARLHKDRTTYLDRMEREEN